MGAEQIGSDAGVKVMSADPRQPSSVKVSGASVAPCGVSIVLISSPYACRLGLKGLSLRNA
jgi:hypothetical protein